MVSEYRVLYTHQKKKKSKVWQDGTLIFNKQGVKGTLLSEDGQTLDVMYTRHHCVGDELESDRYLVTIEEETGRGQEQSGHVQQQQYHTRQLLTKRPRSPTDCSRGHGKRSVSQILGLLYPSVATTSSQQLHGSSNADQSLPSPSPPPNSTVFTLYPDMMTSSSSSCSLFPPTTTPPLLASEQTTLPLLLPGHQIRLAGPLPAVGPATGGSGLVSSHTVERRHSSPERGRWSHYIDTPVKATTAGYWCPPSPTIPPSSSSSSSSNQLLMTEHTVMWSNEACCEQPLPAADTSCTRPTNFLPRSPAASLTTRSTLLSQEPISSFSNFRPKGTTSSLSKRITKPPLRSSCNTSLSHEITTSFTKRPVSSFLNGPPSGIHREAAASSSTGIHTTTTNVITSFQKWPATSPSSTATTSLSTTSFRREAICTTALDQQLFYRKLCPITADPSDFTNRQCHSPAVLSASANTLASLLDNRQLLTGSRAIESQLPPSEHNELMLSPNTLIHVSDNHASCSQRLGEVSQIELNDSLESDDSLMLLTLCPDNLATCVSSDEDELTTTKRSDFKLGLWEFSSDSEP